MNNFFITLLEKAKNGSLDENAFLAELYSWEMATTWYHRHGVISNISDKQLLDLLVFFHTHENLDVYTNEQFQEISKYVASEYGIEKKNLYNAFAEFRMMVYGIAER